MNREKKFGRIIPIFPLLSLQRGSGYIKDIYNSVPCTSKTRRRLAICICAASREHEEEGRGEVWRRKEGRRDVGGRNTYETEKL